MVATTASAPYTYYTASMASGSTTGAYAQLTPSTNTIVFGTVSSTQYGYTANNSPIYFLFDLVSSPSLP